MSWTDTLNITTVKNVRDFKIAERVCLQTDHRSLSCKQPFALQNVYDRGSESVCVCIRPTLATQTTLIILRSCSAVTGSKTFICRLIMFLILRCWTLHQRCRNEWSLFCNHYISYLINFNKPTMNFSWWIFFYDTVILILKVNLKPHCSKQAKPECSLDFSHYKVLRVSLGYKKLTTPWKLANLFCIF